MLADFSPLLPEKTTEKFNPTLEHRGRYLSISVLYFLYFGICQKGSSLTNKELSNRALEVFNCPPEPGTGVRYMQEVPWLVCSAKTEWGTLRYLWHNLC